MQSRSHPEWLRRQGQPGFLQGGRARIARNQPQLGSDTVKKILLPLAIASMLSAGSALAVSTPPASFNVAVTLTSACTVSTPTALTFTYTSMQGGAASPTGGGAFNVTCTNS